MNVPPEPRATEPEERRFALSVWPQTAARAWLAEVSVAGAGEPIRFDRPVDLVLFLTELSDSPGWHPRGLR
ncbi:MAG: hypothetical protein K8R60_11665 [Burkholderiales bacterium]|nr:hypothetical protein [Burkholderiales bacterium]